MQAVLFQAEKVKEELHYQYCWSKGPVVCLRKDSTSRIIKLKSMADLDELKYVFNSKSAAPEPIQLKFGQLFVR